MKLRRFVLLLSLLGMLRGVNNASINDLSKYEQYNKTKIIYHVKILDFTFTTEDRNYFEKNSTIDSG